MSVTKRLNIDDVKAAASGRCIEVLTSLGIPPEHLDSSPERPCPKCDGNTRYRAFDDVNETGGVFCNHCHYEKNGDLFATLMWWHGWTFSEALAKVAEQVGLSSAGRASNKSASLFDQFSRISVTNPQSYFSTWVATKPPITAEAVEAAGAIPASWPLSRGHGKPCLAFPAYRTAEEPSAIVLFRHDGTDFPAFKTLQARKTHLLKGSTPGWHHVGGIERTIAATTVWRPEGLPDAMAMFPHLPDDHAVITSSHGCNWPGNVKKQPPLKFFKDKTVNVIGDADVPGQKGVSDFAPDAAGVAHEVRIVRLPYPIEESHGKDLRDFFLDGHSFEELTELANSAPITEALQPETKSRKRKKTSNAQAKPATWPKSVLCRPVEIADVDTIYIVADEPSVQSLKDLGYAAVAVDVDQDAYSIDWAQFSGKRVVFIYDSRNQSSPFIKKARGGLHQQGATTEVKCILDAPDYKPEFKDGFAPEDVTTWRDHYADKPVEWLRSRLESLPDQWGCSNLAAEAPPPGTHSEEPDAEHQNILALINGVSYDEGVEPLPLSEITERLNGSTDGWPKVSAGQLFHYDKELDRLRTMNKTSQLFAWAGNIMGKPPEFSRSAKCHSREEFFEHLREAQERFDAVELTPHQPPVDGVFYAHRGLPETCGQHFDWLINRFSVASELDRSLVASLFLTPAWGGPGGDRPIFLITADGQNSGKTTLAKVVSKLFGGAIDVQPTEKLKELKERLLSPEGRKRRLVLIDNMKGFRISNAEFEALVTSNRISGREMFVGEGSRPNLLTWMMTSNSPGLSRDLAQRVVNIQLKRTANDPKWASDTFAYVEKHRWEIIADIIGMLRSPQGRLPRFSRWATWESAVLSRLPSAEDAQDLILKRQKELDCDGEESDDIDMFIQSRLEDLNYHISTDVIFIPALLMAEWYSTATRERCSTTRATRAIKRNIGDGLTKRLVIHRTTDQRGFLWVGEKSTGNHQDAHFDIEDRVEYQESRQRWT